jgi:hypothetical protein
MKTKNVKRKAAKENKDYRVDMNDRFEKDRDAIEIHRYQSIGAS